MTPQGVAAAELCNRLFPVEAVFDIKLTSLDIHSFKSYLFGLAFVVRRTHVQGLWRGSWSLQADLASMLRICKMGVVYCT